MRQGMEHPSQYIIRGAIVAVGALSLACGATGGEEGTREQIPANPTTTVDAHPKLQNAKPFPNTTLEEPLDGYTDHYVPSNLAYQYEPGAFELLHRKHDLNTTPPEQRSAPVLDIAIDSSGKLVYEDHTPNGLSGRDLEAFGAAITPNLDLLRAGFMNQTVDRISVRVQDPVEAAHAPYGYPNVDGQYNKYDDTHPDGQLRSTIFVTLHPSQSISIEDLALTIQHEVTHGLTSESSLSDMDKLRETNPEPQELARFQGVCTRLRDITATRLGTRIRRVLDDLHALGKELPAEYQPFVQQTIADIKQPGGFLNVQAKTNSPDNTSENNIPECRLETPWHIVLRKAEQAGLPQPDFLQLSQKAGDLSDKMKEDWNDVIHQDAIYRTLRDANYTPYGVDDLGGHPWDKWDELVTSATTIALTYPEKMGENIADLNDEDKAVAIQILRESLDTVARLNPELRGRCADAEATVLNAAHP